jgi:hypothetical protein
MKDYIEIDQYRFYKSFLDCHTYDNENYKGIKYYTAAYNYDIFINKKADWPRIYIIAKYPKVDEIIMKDLPLNDGTIKLLPESIKIEKIDHGK